MSASGILHKGQFTRRPGAYSQMIADAAGNVGPAPRGTVAILGDTTKCQTGVIQSAMNPTALYVLLDECNVRKAGDIAFSPTTDIRIEGGGASKVTIVGVNQMVQAAMTFANADGDCLKLSSLVYGLPGNRMNVEIAAGTTKGKKVTLHYDGTDYVYDDLGGDAALRLMYDNTGDADAMRVEITPSTDLKIDYTTDQPGNAVYTPSKMVFDSQITFDCDEQQWEKTGTLANEIKAECNDHMGNTGGVFHTAPDAVNPIVAPDATNVASTIFLVNAILTALEAHRVLVGGGPCHGQADTTVASDLSAEVPAATLADAAALATKEKNAYENHRIQTDALGPPNIHAIADAVNVITEPDAIITVDVVITGKYHGSSVVETLTLADPGVSATTSSETFDEVTTIDMTDVMATTTVTITGDAMTVLFADNPYIQNAVDYILSRGSTQGFTATSDLGNASTYACTNLDTVSGPPGTDIKGVAYTDFTADLALIVAGINLKSDLLVAEAVSPGTGAPNNTTATVYLAGGTNAAATPDTWQAALNLLKTEQITAIVMLTSDAAIHEKLRAHLAEREDKNERWGFVGAAANETKTALKARPLSLDSRFLPACFQEVKMYLNGTLQWLEPMYQAAAFAGMFAGRPIGVPLTWKYPKFEDVRQHSTISLPDHADDMIEYGFMFCTVDEDLDKLLIERDVTTYLTQDIPEYSALSASESATECIRDVRRVVKTLIGNPNFGGTVEDVKALVASRLDRQATPTDELFRIKGWDSASLTVEDLGDKLKISFGFTTIEGITFAIITGYVNRAYAQAA